MIGAGLSLPVRACLRATSIVGLQVALIVLVGDDFVWLLLVPPSLLATLAVGSVVRDVEPPLPRPGTFAGILGVLSCYLGVFAAIPFALVVHEALPRELHAVLSYSLGIAAVAALAMRRLVGAWSPTALAGFVGASIAGSAMSMLPIDDRARFVVALLAETALVSFFAGVWLEEAVGARVPS